jgi:large subunit ribosomal protein L21e
MVKAPRGIRHRTRKKMKKSVREKGAVPPLNLLMIEYSPGDLVYIHVNPAIHKGMPHRRYIGMTGVVLGKKGKSYMVEVRVGGKKKVLYIRPEHLKPAGGSITLETAQEVGGSA